MGVPRKNLVSWLFLELFKPDIPMYPLESTYDFLKRTGRANRKQYRDCLRGLKSNGSIDIIKKNNQEFIKVSRKGMLKLFVQKAREVKLPSKWDGKWRLVVFDIPEEFHLERDNFRMLLKKNFFVKLQGSVFISPYPLSRDSVRYLDESGLSKFLRVMKIEEIDNDMDLRKKFNL